MSQDSQYRSDIQDELPVVRGIVLIKNTSAFHEREQAEKHRLEQALQTADSESKAKTEFMNRMSHDFRTPINGILGMLDIIGASEQDPAKTRQCLDKIQISANHLLDLVNDVLDMSRTSSTFWNWPMTWNRSLPPRYWKAASPTNDSAKT